MLAALHREALPEILPLAPQLTYAIPAFDTDALLVEIGLMLEWYLPDRGVELTGDLRAEFVAMWRDLLSKPAAAPKTWVLRDFHSPNLIWLDERHGHRESRHHRLPGHRAGPSRLRSGVAAAGRADRRARATRARAADPLHQGAARVRRRSFDPAGFAELYAIMSAQRNTRLLGTFARLNRRDGKPQYLRHQPRIWTYLSRSLAHPALAASRRMVCRQRAAAGRPDLPLVSQPRLNLRQTCRSRRGAAA